jgi:hypothetical protein
MRAGEAITAALTRRKRGRRTTCPKATTVPIRYDVRSYRLIGETASVFVALGVFGYFIRRSAKKERERERDS